jgi:hypothetical protein
MAEITGSSYLLIQGYQLIVDVWNISNINSPSLVKAYYLDLGDPASKVMDHLQFIKGTTSFFIARTVPDNIILRYDYNLADAVIISESREF